MTMQKIAIIDYGMGNLHSVASALEHVAPKNTILVTGDANEIQSADRVIFPGVGAIRDCMAEIRKRDIDQTVAAVIGAGKPLLAICVGMQALMQSSEENDGISCLGHFDGDVKWFAGNPTFSEINQTQMQTGQKLKVPHMGWNQVEQTQSHPLWSGIENYGRFYFVHSYYVALANSALQAGSTQYGIPFTAAIAKENVFAVQFHPEKSHTNGLQLLKNFVDWNGQA